MRNCAWLMFLVFAAPACNRAPEPPASTAPASRAEVRTFPRGAHWQARMTMLQARSRMELGLDDDTASKLAALQTDLRTFRHELGREVESNSLGKDAAQARMRDRMREVQVAVVTLLGPDRAQRYFRMMAETVERD